MTSVSINSNEEFPRTPFVYSFAEPIGYTLLFIASFMISSLINVFPCERPIPYQLINRNVSNATFVMNLSNNAESLEDTVSNFALILKRISPLLLQIILSKSWGFCSSLQKTICKYIVYLSLNSLATEIIKKYVGYLHLEFYNVCELGIYYYQTCITDGLHVVDARKSSTSGHALILMCSLLLLDLYVNYRFGFPWIPLPVVTRKNYNRSIIEKRKYWCIILRCIDSFQFCYLSPQLWYYLLL